MFTISLIFCFVSAASTGPATQSYKDQYCTDPRTMHKHAAYTEWADAYSCTRHRCQPGGRNLAIYTVGCKRVEAPESAIECEEVVEDTNMQFPFCCTRLRCLVVVRGEVWTRVLGQPWETLPAAPWSHMYKMKKPPPGDAGFLPKTNEGPVYELADPEGGEKVLRSKKGPNDPDCNDAAPRSGAAAPDIVIALSTSNDNKEKKRDNRRKHMRKSGAGLNAGLDDDTEQQRERDDTDDRENTTEKLPSEHSDESFYGNAYAATQSPQVQHRVAWTEIPQNQWNEHEAGDTEIAAKELTVFRPDHEDKKESVSSLLKPSNLQDLVDAIGTRMRDIENVVQRMSEKVRVKPSSPESEGTEERRYNEEELEPRKPHKERTKKLSNPDSEHYKRFSAHNRASKYLHSSADVTSEQPLHVEDNNMNGYFSDASNSVLRRTNTKIEPAIYMAPVDNRRKGQTSSASEEQEKKHKKHTHKRKKSHGKGKRKHHKEEKRRKFNKVNSLEDKNLVSLEDSSGALNQ